MCYHCNEAPQPKLPAEYLADEIQEVRRALWRHEEDQRKSVSYLILALYIFVCGMIIGRARERANPTPTED